jgi:hypothetical protein
MPRKTLKQRKEPNPTSDKSNRIRNVLDNLIGTEDPDDLMIEILDAIQESGRMPSVGKFYVFVYIPKTPNIQYDQNPLVAVTDTFQWGFRGINFHWGSEGVRQYTWDEIPGSLYEVYPEELADLREIPFGKIRLNS